MEQECDRDSNHNWRTRYNNQRMGTRSEGFGNKRTSGDHRNYSIIEIGQNTKRIPLQDALRVEDGQHSKNCVSLLVWKSRN